jgi:hypothetical protein
MALRDIRIQLEIDTGAGNMCPCSDDFFIKSETMGLYLAAGIDFDVLDKKPATEVCTVVGENIEKFYIHDPQRDLLDALIDECLTSPRAVLSVMEFSA